MFQHCIFCHGKLPPNQSVEAFPVGRRIAYDPHRGRLWAVCPSCQRWNLAPFDARWEALEELERARRAAGRVLSSTENIALIQVEDVELVRVGRARLTEEAWWRYGQQMLRRRTRHKALRATETTTLVAASLMTGGFFYLFSGNILNNAVRFRKFGPLAWRGEVACITCGGLLHEISFRRARFMHLTRDNPGDGAALHMQCTACRSGGRVGEHQLEGPVAEHLLRRVMTFHHFHGASEQRVRAATGYIDRLGSPDAVTREMTRAGMRLDYLFDGDRRTQAVALEIALNEDAERRLLEMELAELEARWKQEEEIAAIADSLLTPSVEPLRRARNGDGGEPH